MIMNMQKVFCMKKFGTSLLLWGMMLSVCSAAEEAVNFESNSSAKSVVASVADPVVKNLSESMHSLEETIYIVIGIAWVALLLVVICVCYVMYGNLQKKMKKHYQDVNRDIEAIKRTQTELERKFAQQLNDNVYNTNDSLNSLREQIERLSSRFAGGYSQPAANQNSMGFSMPATESRRTAPQPVSRPNMDGIIVEETARVQAFCNDYNDMARNAATNVAHRNKLKQEAVQKYGLKGVKCINAAAVLNEKAAIEFASSETAPEFYAYHIKQDLYAVVPAIGRSWQSIDVNLILSGMFDVKCRESARYNFINVGKEALFTLHGSRWILKRKGQVELS